MCVSNDKLAIELQIASHELHDAEYGEGILLRLSSASPS